MTRPPIPAATDSVLWNANSKDWLVHAEGDVRHMHPLLSTGYGCDSEMWLPGGDGVASISNIQTGDLARVLSVSAGVAGASGGPYVDMSPSQNVYSDAHDLPSSSSDASGLGQHDNLFSIHYNSSGSTPTDPVLVTFLLQGTWNLAGDSEPDDNWWADWFGFGEVYDSADGKTLASDSLYHYLSGPGAKSDGGIATLQFSAMLSYDKLYSLRFFMDLESHAQATVVPAPSAIGLLGTGLVSMIFIPVARRISAKRHIFTGSDGGVARWVIQSTTGR